jgi:shikimate kinase
MLRLDYDHVRRPVARVSGNAVEGSSIGGGTAAFGGHSWYFRVMSETIPSASANSSREAAIVAALGRRCIVLVGMMGAGKSTVGRRLAARLRLPFRDADIEIEAAAAMTIPEIFQTHGEPHFRDGEARVIGRLLDNGPVVLATGGGAFMREETRQRVAAKAVSLWLQADADVILRRVKRRADRPLLQTADPAGTIAALIEQRHPMYQTADITIASRDVPHDKIVDECVDALHQHLCAAADPAGAAPTRNDIP